MTIEATTKEYRKGMRAGLDKAWGIVHRAGFELEKAIAAELEAVSPFEVAAPGSGFDAEVAAKELARRLNEGAGLSWGDTATAAEALRDAFERGRRALDARPTCDVPGCSNVIPEGGEGSPEMCPVCLAAERKIEELRVLLRKEGT